MVDSNKFDTDEEKKKKEEEEYDLVLDNVCQRGVIRVPKKRKKESLYHDYG